MRQHKIKDDDSDLSAALRKLHSTALSKRQAGLSAIFTLNKSYDLSLEIISAATQRYPYDVLDRGVNYELLSSLWGARDRCIVPAIEAVYDLLEDKREAREAALRLLIEQGTRASLKACARLLKRASSRTVNLAWVFAPLSPGKARFLFPEILEALWSLDHPGPVLEFISRMACARRLRLDDYPTFAEECRQRARQIMRDWSVVFRERASLGRENLAKFTLARDLLEYLFELAKFFRDVRWNSLLRAAPACMDLAAATSLLARGEKVSSQKLRRLAESPASRWRLWTTLETIGRLDAFPAQYRRQELLAEAEMVRWLEHPAELGRAPAAIVLVTRAETGSTSRRNAFYFFSFRHPDFQGGVDFVGEAGPYRLGQGPAAMYASRTFSRFEALRSKTVDDHIFDYLSCRPFRLPGESVPQSWSARLAHRRLRTLAHIRRIDLANERVSDVDLAHFGRLTHLESLNLQGTKIRDRGLASIHGLRTLRELNLCGTRITDEAKATLASLCDLVQLELDETSVSDSIVDLFGTLRKLESVSLNGCKLITDEFLESMPAASSCTVLSLINTSVSERAVRAFERSRPNTELIY